MTLSKKWGISPDISKKTLQVTTQSGTRAVFHPSLYLRFRTNDRSLRYQKFSHNVFGDTLIGVTNSRRGNKYVEVFATNFGWTRLELVTPINVSPNTLYENF